MNKEQYLDKKRDEILFSMFGNLAERILNATDGDKCPNEIREILDEVWEYALTVGVEQS